jgi:hypothetical protein
MAVSLRAAAPVGAGDPIGEVTEIQPRFTG